MMDDAADTVKEDKIEVEQVITEAAVSKKPLFSFPYAEPYQIQIDFMKSLFTAIEEKKLGIFESPTGTGKSLSLLCGALTWLQMRELQRFRELRAAIADFNEKKEEQMASEAENWMLEQTLFRKRKNLVYKAKRELKFLENCLEKRKKILQYKPQPTSTSDTSVHTDNKSKEEEDPLLNFLNDEFAPELANSDDDDDDLDEADENEPEFYPYRVIFGSRTHSQLSQFSKELKRTVFAKQISTVTLGSRQNLCINSDVTKLKNLSLMNERCLELQKSSKGRKTGNSKKQKGCSGCQYFSQSAIEKLKNQILTEVLDIEDLVGVAKQSKACPYYACRKAAKEAQLILLPYNTILHSGTRAGVGLSINKNSVLLLDEAHNIIEGVSGMYSTRVTLPQLSDCQSGLKLYINKYRSRFNPKNLLHYKQLAFVLRSLVSFMEKDSSTQESVLSVREFKGEVGIEALDFYEILKFVNKSKIVFKLKGYLSLLAKESAINKVPLHNSSNQAIISFIEFLKSVVTYGSQGKIIRDGIVIKFLLLNTSEHFSYLVNSARSIILAGGTMKPYEDIEDQLFYSAKERITHFSCDHVIPDTNLKCIALSHGPSSVLFDFTFKNRNSQQLLEELSRTIQNVARVVPGGLVIFFPSYDYENLFYLHLQEFGMLKLIESKKKIFREPKDSNCERVLIDYGRQIRNNSFGAIIFAVVGGKLSEGINFGDDLGRCVIVVGLPYPNVTSIDIKEKLNFVTEKFGAEKAKLVLPNACFKAVNQSIGRSIRHSNDYATIILLDHRFLAKESQNQLPNWILSKYVSCSNFGQCIGVLGKFFASKEVMSDPIRSLNVK